MKQLLKIPIDLYKIVLVKTVRNSGVCYYRAVNLDSLDTHTITPSELIDRIINDRWVVTNLRSVGGVLEVLNDDGYRGLDNVVVVDEFQETPSLLDYCNALAESSNFQKNIIQDFNVIRNKKSPGKMPVDSLEKVYWTCKKGHSVYCDIATYIALGGECPICKHEEHGFDVSLYTWAKYTGNGDILLSYNMSNNPIAPDEIGCSSQKEINLHGESIKVCKLMKRLREKEAGLVKLGYIAESGVNSGRPETSV